ncbi:MAG: sigma-54-dependent Fis family transcriptional regulator [Nitrospirae bacterium]|nr:sigma-54-dependent Fis family transcriptional regulator [Nitrospirota bacterium]
MSARVLLAIADDESRERVKASLQGEDIETEDATSWPSLVQRTGDFALYVLDSELPGAAFPDTIRELQSIDTEGGVIIVLGPDDTEKAVEAMRQGAEDYLAVPFRSESEVALRLKRGLLQSRMRKELENLKESLHKRFQLDGMLGKSKAMQEIFRGVMKIAPTEATVLITGESGTGKELFARTVHFNSLRADRKFVAVDCGALTETLLTSELFGHERGAFTGAIRARKGLFEEAQGGTIFLDEIGNTSVGFQVKMLRVLEEKRIQRVGSTTTIPVDVRVIAATNRNIEQAVTAGSFREDLYYRLNVFELHLPPLRERPEDVPLLASHFLKLFSDKMNKNIGRFTESALKRILDYPWPGNVRELENAIERAVVLCEKDEIEETLLPLVVQGGLSPAGVLEMFSQPWHTAHERFDTEYLRRVLDQCGWNITRAADAAHIPRQTIHYKIRKYGLRSSS